jgi:pyruvate formate lyase activating enzyme
VTLSGGEALLQAESIELLKLLKEKGAQTAVDTCGHVKTARIADALPHTDVVLYDLKIADSTQHARFTGAGNELIFANLQLVVKWAAAGKVRLWIRTPVIPGATDSDANIAGLADVIAAIPNAEAAIERWELCAFNKLCISKYESIKRDWEFALAPLMSGARMDELVAVARAGCPGLDICATGSTTDE